MCQRNLILSLLKSASECSCLENPRDGGTWWAAVYGVTQSRTRLKRLSSSSKEMTRSKAQRTRWSVTLHLVCSQLR